ncbi:unnamed protein product [Rotaria sp. Silwood2]|nr:unnamed protein product [Rotaria sp. Silwood2]CAF2899065.1 unnamed protein product [Rotaria sp. Silwood2]CAF3073452.1 unnamed protein product [Rotaria sp. Silwood2]CAF3260729.1 unnamed protein product [Rotaria sp. Silwood2]CAF4150715.1 unnamed protein product [Rotaria sp. Silwood2]
MSVPSIETDNRSSIIIDDNMSVMVHDLSDTTVTSHTSASWHSVVSDIHINNNLLIRSHSINTWLKICLIEPDIRLTTAQEWKLRTCMRRLLSICNLPLKISCIKIKEFIIISNENESIPFIDQKEQSLPMVDSSLTTLITHPCLHQGQTFSNQLEQLGLYLRILSLVDANNGLLEVKLFEFYSKKLQNSTIIHIPLIKSPKFVFHISLNILKLSLRSKNSLLELQFSTRENESIRGNYYKWNEINNEHIKFNINVDIDHSLINQFSIV